MRRLVVLLSFCALLLASCGPPSLSKVESKAVQGVITNLADIGYTCQQGQIVGVVQKNARGNKVTIVYITCTQAGSPNGNNLWAFIAVDVDQKGNLIWADMLVQSQMLAVAP